jgi:hypothetical protein
VSGIFSIWISDRFGGPSEKVHEQALTDFHMKEVIGSAAM